MLIKYAIYNKTLNSFISLNMNNQFQRIFNKHRSPRLRISCVWGVDLLYRIITVPVIGLLDIAVV